MKRFMFVLVAVISLALFAATPDKALAQSTVGLRLFETKCASCHQSAQNQKAPDASRLRKMTPEAVFAALSRAPHTQIQGLSDDDKKTVAAYLG
jgi:cytochrome c553